jgi:SAM-dependent methyltransferase
VLWNDTTEIDVAVTLGLACELEATDEQLQAQLDRAETAQRELLRAVGISGLRAALAQDRLPLPPAAAREFYYGDDHLGYWLYGYGDLLLLREHASLAGARVLDFGCSSGRVLRHLYVHERGAELVGVDIGVHNVGWVRRHLPILVLQGSVIPTLPFADDSIDVVYAGSVFTHIDETEEAWLCELRRVMCPGAIALVTFHPERLWQEMSDNPRHLLRTVVEASPHRMEPPGGAPIFVGRAPGKRVVFTATTVPVNNANVIHSRSYIAEKWGRIFEVVGFIERAHGDHQDAVILRA